MLNFHPSNGDKSELAWVLFLSYADDETQANYIRNLAESEKGIMEAELIIGHIKGLSAVVTGSPLII